MRTDPVVKRRYVLLAIGACTVVLGVAIASFGLMNVSGDDSTTNYQGVSVFGAFAASLGIGVIVYAAFSTQLSLWDIDPGEEPASWVPLALMAFGLMLIVFEFGYIAILLATDVPTTLEAEVGFIIVCVASVSVLAGAAARFVGRRAREESSEPSRRMRLMAGSLALLAGVGVEITVPFVIGPMDPAVPLTAMFLGIVSVVVGLGILTGPYPRPWVPGGYGAR